MKVFMDYRDRAVRLTDSRKLHIVQDDDPDIWVQTIGDALQQPDDVKEDFHHPEVRMFYRIYTKKAQQNQGFHVVVKVRGYDMIVVTAFLARGMSWGGTGWTN
ncbi:hypothetical protein KJ564_13015 [bacterium]|nr:hypothetical protein [bacterium]